MRINSAALLVFFLIFFVLRSRIQRRYRYRHEAWCWLPHGTLWAAGLCWIRHSKVHNGWWVTLRDDIKEKQSLMYFCLNVLLHETILNLLFPIIRLECDGPGQPALCPVWTAEQGGCRGQIRQKDRRRILQVQVMTFGSVSVSGKRRHCEPVRTQDNKPSD